jgi:ABC-2 type transport system ATP-binding protein
VLVTSHLLSQVEEVCDRVAILEHGRLTVECAIGEFTAKHDRQTLVLSKLPEDELAELHAWLAARGHTLEALGIQPGRLEELVTFAPPQPEPHRASA